MCLGNHEHLVILVEVDVPSASHSFLRGGWTRSGDLPTVPPALWTLVRRRVQTLLSGACVCSGSIGHRQGHTPCPHIRVDQVEPRQEVFRHP